MRAALVVVVAASAVSCTTFSSSTTDGADASTSCWPNGSCPGNTVCCVALDGTGACTSASQCPSDHASLGCLRQGDCPSGFCCVDATVVMDGGATLYYPRSSCTAVECPRGSGGYRLCDGPADCASQTTCRAQPKFVPTNLALCQ